MLQGVETVHIQDGTTFRVVLCEASDQTGISPTLRSDRESSGNTGSAQNLKSRGLFWGWGESLLPSYFPQKDQARCVSLLLLLSAALQLLMQSFGLPKNFLPSSSILDKSLPVWHFLTSVYLFYTASMV